MPWSMTSAWSWMAVSYWRGDDSDGIAIVEAGDDELEQLGMVEIELPWIS